jgi:hypothetical protein
MKNPEALSENCAIFTLIAGGKSQMWKCQMIVFLLLAVLTSCARPRNTEVGTREAISALQKKLSACVAEKNPQGDFKLAVVSITHQGEETLVNIVAFNPADVVADKNSATSKTSPKGSPRIIDFDAPVYLMSRGRWLLNETGRVYLIDENCREYKLRDRKFLMRQATAKSGRVQLAPGEACEVQLSFGRVSETAQGLLLVYGQHILPAPLPVNQ